MVHYHLQDRASCCLRTDLVPLIVPLPLADKANVTHEDCAARCRAEQGSEVVYLDSVSPWDPRTCLYVYERFRTLRATTVVKDRSAAASSTLAT